MAGQFDLIYGQGIAFPLTMEEGRPVITTGSDLIKFSIANLLAWGYGQRYFLGHFGTKAERLIERPADDVTVALIREYVIESITRFEKRIKLISVNVNMDGEKIDILLKYKIIDNNTVDSFIIPFYSKIRH